MNFFLNSYEGHGMILPCTHSICWWDNERTYTSRSIVMGRKREGGDMHLINKVRKWGWNNLLSFLCRTLWSTPMITSHVNILLEVTNVVHFTQCSTSEIWSWSNPILWVPSQARSLYRGMSSSLGGVCFNFFTVVYYFLS